MKISGGGLYYNLHKLVKEGYISEQNVERDGNYPDRHVYQITSDGTRHFYGLLRDTLSDTNKDRAFFDPLDAALLFGTLLSKEEVVMRLQHQIDRRQAKVLQLDIIYNLLKQIKDLNLPYMLLLIDHSISRIGGDVEWLKKTKQRILTDPEFSEAHRTQSPSGVGGPVEDDAMQNMENAKSWHSFENKVDKAYQSYQQKLAQLWREYETSQKIFGNSPQLLLEARQTYQKKADQAFQEYQTFLQEQHDDMAKIIAQAQELAQKLEARY